MSEGASLVLGSFLVGVVLRVVVALMFHAAQIRD